MGFFSGLLKGAIGLLGGGKGILGGISSAADYKAQKERAEIEAKGNIDLAKEQGKEQRKTSKYEMELASAVDEYGRARKRGAFKNFGFASKNDPYAQTAMQGYERQWSPQDTKLVLPNEPGTAVPVAPVPVNNAVPRR